MLHGGVYRSTATADTDCVVYRIRSRDLSWALNKNPDLWTALYRPDVATRLRAVPLLRSLADAQIEQLAKDTKVIEYAAGQLIGDSDGSGTPEEADSGLWLIDWGQVETVARFHVSLDASGALKALPESGSDQAQAEQQIPHLTAGNWFCTGLVKIRNQRIIQARAKTQVRLLFIPGAQAEQLAQRHEDAELMLSRPLRIEKILMDNLSAEEFAGLTQDHWRDLAGYTSWEHVPRGFAVTIQGDQPDALYLLVDGEAVIRATDAEGRDRPSQALEPYHSYGLGALLVRERSDATIRAVTGKKISGKPDETLDGCDWLALHRKDLLYMTDANPSLWANTRLRIALTRAPERRKHKWLEEEETELYYDRQHWIVLLPWLTPLFLVLGTAVFLMLRSESLAAWTSTLSVIVAAFVAIITVIAFPLILWNYLDDYYAITDRRVIHRKRVLLFYDNQIEAPLSSVQDVSVETDFVGRLLDYGDLIIQTAAEQGRISFDRVPDPERVEAIIFEQTRRSEAGRQAVRLEALRESIIKDMKLRLFAFRPEQVLPAGLSLQKQSWIDVLGQRIPRRLKATSRPNATVFRKHKIFLLKRTILPFLALLLSIAVAFVVYASPDQTELRCVVLLLPVVSAIWLRIQYENWRNDEYILTDSHIIDIEASALRLREKRRQAEWEKVQNAKYVIDGVLPRVLNYGTVIIQTAAAVGEFDFVNVGNPRRVQQEIFQRLENYRARRENDRTRQQQEDFRRALRTYDDLIQEDNWPSRPQAKQP
jgi:CRP-like cAMP-binding protein/membrane protein YdbS with pleckstrin-like domain